MSCWSTQNGSKLSFDFNDYISSYIGSQQCPFSMKALCSLVDSCPFNIVQFHSSFFDLLRWNVFPCNCFLVVFVFMCITSNGNVEWNVFSLWFYFWSELNLAKDKHKFPLSGNHERIRSGYCLRRIRHQECESISSIRWTERRYRDLQAIWHFVSCFWWSLCRKLLNMNSRKKNQQKIVEWITKNFLCKNVRLYHRQQVTFMMNAGNSRVFEIAFFSRICERALPVSVYKLPIKTNWCKKIYSIKSFRWA